MKSIDIKVNKDLLFSFLNKSDEEFSRFSYIDVLLNYRGEKILIYQNDYLQEALDRILGGCKQVLESEQPFPEEYDFNRGIFYYNQLYMMSFDDNAKHLKTDFPKADPTDKITWLLSTNGGYQTFLYNYKNDIYLEVTRSQEYVYDENENIDINYFQEWLKNYSVDYRFKLTKSELTDFIKDIENRFGEYSSDN